MAKPHLFVVVLVEGLFFVFFIFFDHRQPNNCSLFHPCFTRLSTSSTYLLVSRIAMSLSVYRLHQICPLRTVIEKYFFCNSSHTTSTIRFLVNRLLFLPQFMNFSFYPYFGRDRTRLAFAALALVNPGTLSGKS